MPSGEAADRSVVALLAEMVLLPVTAFLYGMELLVRAMQGTRGAAEQSLHDIAGAAPRRAAAHPAADAAAKAAAEGEQEQRVTGGGPPPQPAQKETATMDTSIGYESRRDRDLRDDTLKLVRFKILFVKREYEVAFAEEEDLVYDNMDGTAFASWKVAEFIQRLHEPGVPLPRRWQSRGYPPGPEGEESKKYIRGGKLRGLPEEDKKYLRVYYEVLDRYPREKFRHEEQQIRVLEQIRDGIRDRDKPSDGPDRDGGGYEASSGGAASSSDPAPSGGADGGASSGGGATPGGGAWTVGR